MIRNKTCIRILILGISCFVSGHLYSVVSVAAESKVAAKKPRTSLLIETKKYIATLFEEHYKNVQTELSATKAELIAQANAKSEIIAAKLLNFKEDLEDIKTILQKPTESPAIEPAILPVQDQLQEKAAQETNETAANADSIANFVEEANEKVSENGEDNGASASDVLSQDAIEEISSENLVS